MCCNPGLPGVCFRGNRGDCENEGCGNDCDMNDAIGTYNVCCCLLGGYFEVKGLGAIGFFGSNGAEKQDISSILLFSNSFFPSSPI
jgi:hypothetical protein